MRAGYALVRILGPSAVTAIVRSACAPWLPPGPRRGASQSVARTCHIVREPCRRPVLFMLPINSSASFARYTPSTPDKPAVTVLASRPPWDSTAENPRRTSARSHRANPSPGQLLEQLLRHRGVKAHDDVQVRVKPGHPVGDFHGSGVLEHLLQPLHNPGPFLHQGATLPGGPAARGSAVGARRWAGAGRARSSGRSTPSRPRRSCDRAGCAGARR